MYPTLLPGERISCPMTYGRGTHVLLANYSTGELFCHCIHLKQRNRKTDIVLASAGERLTESEANMLYVAWRDEIFRKAAEYAN